ncbi:Arc family DNA-binding protein [Vibrio cholerae]|nr:Arc family DNA-binding protein [Vibrio cholerae]
MIFNMSRYKNPQYQLRMAPELKEKIQERADKAGRSLHAEIIYRLEKSIEGDLQLEDLTEKDAFQQILQVNAQIRVLTDVLDKLTLKAAVEAGKVQINKD